MKAIFDMQSHSLLIASCPVFPYVQWNPASSLCPDKCPAFYSCQLAHRAVALVWPGDKKRLWACVCLFVFHRQMHFHPSLEVSVHLDDFFCVCVCLYVQVNWQERTRPVCSVWKISSTLQAPLLRCWTGPEQVVVCLSKYKHGRNNERCFIS